MLIIGSSGSGQTGNGGTKDVEIMVPLKYLCSFWRTLEVILNSSKWYKTLCSCCIFINSKKIKLLKKLESGFKRTISWKKYLAKTTNWARNRYSDYLIDPNFWGVNRLFFLSFKDDDGRESHKQYYLPTMEIKDY